MSADDSKQKTDSTDRSVEAPVSKIGPIAMRLGEHITETFGPEASIAAVIVVAEVIAPDGQGGYVDSIEYASNEHRRWVQMALLQEAANEAEACNERRVAGVARALGLDEDDEE